MTDLGYMKLAIDEYKWNIKRFTEKNKFIYDESLFKNKKK